MRILYLTSGFPWPLTSGYLRHYFLIRELASQHEITLVSLVNRRFRPEYVDALAPLTRDVYTFPAEPGRRAAGSLIRSLRWFAGGEHAAREMQRAVRRLVSEREFDLAIFSGKHTLPALRSLRGLPLIADICDAASVRYRGAIPYSGLARRVQCRVAATYMRRTEGRIIRAASHVLFASARDRDALVPAGSRRATVVPNGVDLGFWNRGTRERGRRAIVFTGAMSYGPNADAASFLIDQVFPRVRAVVPEAEVWIVGRDPGPALIAAGRQPGVKVTGFVDDVRPWLERACVFAAPLRFGAGIQNKLLEALAMEVPIVASPLAANGLRMDDGTLPPLTIAEGPEATAEQLVRLLRAAQQCPEPDAAGRRFVARHFDWSASASKVEEIMQSIAPAVEERAVAGEPRSQAAHLSGPPVRIPRGL